MLRHLPMTHACRVFCPAARTMVHLTPLPAGGIGAADVDVPAAVPATEADRAALDFLGPMLPDDIARGIAAGGYGG
jgi:exonuclease-1